MTELFSSFIFLFAVIDPIGSIPVFMAVTKNFSDKERKTTAIRAVLISAAILIFFIVAGELILNAIKIPLPAFQIAGGIVLFLFALTMIFGDSKPEEEIKKLKNTHETAIFPLAIPSIASPGAMLAVVLLTENTKYSILEQFKTSLVMLLVLLLVLVLLLISTKVQKIIGDGGANIISRVMGLILSALAVTNVLNGIQSFFKM